MQAEIGKVLEGKVTGITKFGAFVDIGEERNGMVHISEISSSFVNNVSDYLQEGQMVKVKVINITDDGKIALSMKQLEEKCDKSTSTQTKKKPSTITNEKSTKDESQSFEDMLAKFKQVSDERMSDLKKMTESKRGVGVPKRGAKGARQK